MKDKINIEDLPKDLQKKVKIENGISTRNYPLTKDDVRSHALAVLNAIRSLTKDQRTRVLNHALKVNRV